MSLIVTGSIGIDSVETPSGSAPEVLGGSAVYFAAAASFFTPVRLVAAVGEDFPDHHMDTFRHFDIDLSGLESRKGSRTFRWSGRYHDNMNDRDTVTVDLNVLGEELPPVPEAFRDSRYVFLANTAPAGQMSLLEQFPQCRLSIADTMDLWIDTQRDGLLELMTKISGLVLNDSEAAMLTGKSNLIQAAEAIVGMGPRFVVIKKGEHGALLYHAEGAVAIPAWPARDVVDPTGAGDCFAGGMMGYLAQAGDESFAAIRRAIAYGTIVASFNIESFSLERLKAISRSDIDERMNAYAGMLSLG